MPGLGIGIGLGMGAGRPAGPWSLERLYRGKEGAAFSLSAFEGLYQDAAGATPVSALEQSIGRQDDRSGNGHHATQETSGARPVLSARTNLLTKTEDLTNAAWLKFGSPTVTGGQAAPDGSNTAFLIESTGSSPSFIGVAVAQSSTVTVRVRTKGGTRATANFLLRNDTTATAFTGGTLNYSTGAIGAPWTSKSLGDGWWEITYTQSTGITPGDTLWFYVGNTGSPLAAGQNWYVWHPQINNGPEALPYQAVDTATAYDADGVLPYQYFDGTDDALVTTSGGASSAAMIVMGFQAAAVGSAQTLFSDMDGNTGLKLGISATGEIEFSGGNGASIDTATGDIVVPGVDYVATAIYDGERLSVKLDSFTVVQDCALSAGAAEATIGANGSSEYFRGRIYSMVYVKDAAVSATDVQRVRELVASLSGVTLRAEKVSTYQMTVPEKYNKAIRPRFVGVLEDRQEQAFEYPTGVHWGQFIMFVDSDTDECLMVRAEGDGRSMQRWYQGPGGDSLEIDFYGKEVRVVEELHPSWEAAADSYKAWAQKQKWWKRKTNNPLPKFIHTAVGDAASMTTYMTDPRFTVELSPADQAVWPTQWRTDPYDENLPEFTPKEGFLSQWAAMEAMGFKVVPHFSFRAMSSDHADYGTDEDPGPLRQYASRIDTTPGLDDAKNEKFNDFYPKIRFACVCHAGWRSLIQAKIDAVGTNGVYLDALATQAITCWSDQHGHAVPSRHDTIPALEAMLDLNADRWVMVEGFAEALIPKVDAFLCHLETDNPNRIPLLKRIYGDIAPIVGWQMNYEDDTVEEVEPKIAEATRTFGHAAFGSPYLQDTSDSAVFGSDLRLSIPDGAPPEE